MGETRKKHDFNFYGKTRAFPQHVRFSTILLFRVQEPWPYYENVSKSCVFTRILKFQIEGRGRSSIRLDFKAKALGLLPLAPGILENRLVGESHFKPVATYVRVVIRGTFSLRSPKRVK